jgi:hypothetical protein
MGVHTRGEESVSLHAKRAFPYGTYGQTRPGRRASSTAVPCVLLTRKGSQVQTLSRPPAPSALWTPPPSSLARDLPDKHRTWSTYHVRRPTVKDNSGERADHTLCRILRLRLSNELAAKWCTKETVAPVNAEGCCSVADGTEIAVDTSPTQTPLARRSTAPRSRQAPSVHRCPRMISGRA